MLAGGISISSYASNLLSSLRTMTVENAHAFLDEMKKTGPSPELMSKISSDFTKDHMKEALDSRGISLTSASGGNTAEWVGVGTSAAAAGA
jgi:hypothetical protein